MSPRLTLLVVLFACPLLATCAGSERGSTAAAPQVLSDKVVNDEATNERVEGKDGEDEPLEDEDGEDEPLEDGEDEPLDIGHFSEATNSLLPAKVSVVAIGVLTSIKLVHDNIQAAFKSMPGNSCLFLFSFLGMFCWTVLGMMWQLDENTLGQLGLWTTLSSYIATVNLMLTPLILLVPDQNKSKELAESINKEAQERVQRAYERNKTQVALLYVCVMIFQVTSAVSVFRVAALKQADIQGGMAQMQHTPWASGLGSEGEDGQKEDLTGPVMATLLYLILSWCSLCVLYERMFPGRSFAADFPAQVLDNAFPCIESRLGKSSSDLADQLKEQLDNMNKKMKSAACFAEEQADQAMGELEDGLDQVGMEVPPEIGGLQDELQATKADLDRMSSAVAGLLDNFRMESEGITARVNKFVQDVDSIDCMFKMHYAAYVVYGVSALVFTGWLGTRIAVLVIQKYPCSRAALVYLIVALLVLFSFFAIILLVVSCGAMAPRKQEAIVMCQRPQDTEVPSSWQKEEEKIVLKPTCGPSEQIKHIIMTLGAVSLRGEAIFPKGEYCSADAYEITYEDEGFLLEDLKDYEDELNILETEIMQQGLESSQPLLGDQEVADAKDGILKARRLIEALRAQCEHNTRAAQNI